MRTQLTLFTAAVVLVMACSSPATPTATSTTTSTATATGSIAANAPAMYQRFSSSSVTITVEGTNVVLKSNAVPDHKSPYWGTSNALYEAPHAGMIANPNLIVAQTLTLRVPGSPAVASASSDTPMGPIGMAINGVPLFNQYAAGRSPLTGEIISFDRYNGHPQQSGQYHYHLEPLWLTAANGPSSLIGVLLDGFPVYGPKDSDGSTPSNLDSCNGHSHATADVSSGIYHYHATTAVPYLSGCYKGTAGSIG
jgi:hypothetical protein